MVIILAFVSIPITTAIYIERALNKNHKVLTLGIKPDDEYNNNININLPSKELDIVTDLSPDIKLISDTIKSKIVPDLFLWIDSGTNFFPKNIEQLDYPSAAYFIDSHLNLKKHIELAKHFDFIFIAQKEYVNIFKKHGIKSVHWLPLACDPEIHKNYNLPPKNNICFIGSTNLNPRRLFLLEKIKMKHSVFSDRLFLNEMALAFSESKIVFNSSVKNDLNMRFFETLSTGSLLLTDMAKNSGQDELFIANEEIVCYEDETINNTIDFYLENDELREAIARRGYEMTLNAHTYQHRVEDLLSVVVGNKKTTKTTKELRELSTKNCSVSTNKINKLKRSFIIPVIDYSPASSYNILTLLKDLEQIEGNVIIIFNSEIVADEIKNHPRIDNYAIMKKNVGVSRAWNIGLEMSDTPITFILNSDLHIKKNSIDKLENALINLDSAAIVAPQGSYNHFDSKQDILYFDKGTFKSTIEVDSVSGFFFAVKTKYFHQAILKFDNIYTPCYFEEWDIGLQIRNVGLKSYIVPVTEYFHKWSGSIKSMTTIKYYDKENTADEIRKRNLILYHNKWSLLHSQNKVKDEIFISCWVDEQLQKIQKLILHNFLNEAIRIVNILKDLYPEYTLIYYYEALINYANGEISSACKILNNILEKKPDFEQARLLLDELSK